MPGGPGGSSTITCSYSSMSGARTGGPSTCPGTAKQDCMRRRRARRELTDDEEVIFSRQAKIVRDCEYRALSLLVSFSLLGSAGRSLPKEERGDGAEGAGHCFC
jgi:hypothetical protein